MHSQGLTEATAVQWRAAGPLRWARWFPVAAWVVALLVSMTFENLVCSVTDPTICGPDLHFSVAAVFLFGALVLLWWPPAAIGCAVVFAVFDVLYDPTPQAKVAWSVTAVVYLAWGAHRAHRRARQRAILAAATVPVRPPSEGPPLPFRWGEQDWRARAAILLLPLVAAGCWFAWTSADAADRASAARAVTVPATVEAVAPDDATRLRLRLQRAVNGVPDTLELTSNHDHPVGQTVSLRVDPVEPERSFLAAEPPDSTWWVTLSLGAVVLTAVAVAWLLVGLRARRRLARMPLTAGVPVQALLTPGEAGLGTVDGSSVVATLEVAASTMNSATATAATDAGHRLTRHDAFWAGDLSEGGWTVLLTPDGRLVPTSRIATLPPGIRADPEDDDVDMDIDDPLSGTRPVPTVGVEPAHLPIVLRAPLWQRTLAAGGLVLLPALAWLGADLSEGPVRIGLLTLFGASAIHWLVGLCLGSVRIDADEITATGAVRRSVVRVADAVDVRLDGDLVLLAFADESVLTLGPFEGGAEGVGLSLDAARAGGRSWLTAGAVQRISPALGVTVAGVLVTALALWWPQLSTLW